jgi:hypothetical protein
MKALTLILSILFSLFSGSGKEGHVSAAPSSDKVTGYTLHKEMCITAAQGCSFFGTENSNTISVRTSQTGRRAPQSTKTPSRLVRTGKIIDTHNFNPFLSALFPKADGAQSFFRYIYSICCLRL